MLKTSKNEFLSICKAMNNVKHWQNWIETRHTVDKLHDILKNIIDYCENKFNWKMDKLRKNLKPLTRRFFYKDNAFAEYFDGDEPPNDDNFEEAEECCTFSDFSDWDDEDDDTEHNKTETDNDNEGNDNVDENN